VDDEFFAEFSVTEELSSVKLAKIISMGKYLSDTFLIQNGLK
jgi:hypothetical protein